MKYKISVKASQDIENIWLYTFETWSSEQADRYVNLIFDEIEYLSDKPTSGKDFSHERLLVTDQLFVIERTLKLIQTEKEKSMKAAVESLYNDYKMDKELTAFTDLDKEPFYETR